MTECSNCWQPISLIPGSCWWVYFTWRQHLLGIYFTIAGNCWGFISLECSICWGSILLLLALAGGFISLECSICWGSISLLLAIAGGSFHWNAAFSGALFYYC